MAFPRPQISNFSGGACPQTPSGLACLWRANFSPPRVHLQNLTLRYQLLAYEINAQGWKKRLGLDRVGGWGGGGAFIKLLLPRGVQFSYVIIWGGGGKVLIHHTFLNPSPGT